MATHVPTLSTIACPSEKRKIGQKQASQIAPWTTFKNT